MQKTYKIVVASMIGASILFTGCSWVKDKLQSTVDDVNKGISDTAKDVGNQLDNAVKDATTPTPATEEKTEEKTEPKAEEKAETPAK